MSYIQAQECIGQAANYLFHRSMPVLMHSWKLCKTMGHILLFETNMPYIGQLTKKPAGKNPYSKKNPYCYKGRPKIESIKIVSFSN